MRLYEAVRTWNSKNDASELNANTVLFILFHLRALVLCIVKLSIYWFHLSSVIESSSRGGFFLHALWWSKWFYKLIIRSTGIIILFLQSEYIMGEFIHNWCLFFWISYKVAFVVVKSINFIKASVDFGGKRIHKPITGFRFIKASSRQSDKFTHHLTYINGGARHLRMDNL